MYISMKMVRHPTGNPMIVPPYPLSHSPHKHPTWPGSCKESIVFFSITIRA